MQFIHELPITCAINEPVRSGLLARRRIECWACLRQRRPLVCPRPLRSQLPGRSFSAYRISIMHNLLY
jgi:hypothetical protein